MKKDSLWKPTLWLLPFAFLTNFPLGGEPIDSYEVYTGIARTRKSWHESLDLAVLRRFRSSGQINYLAVNPNDLRTYVFNEEDISIKPVTAAALRAQYGGTPYFLAIKQVEANGMQLQDAGITHATPRQRGIDLTIDLCPSRRHLDRIFFTQIIGYLGEAEQPIPLAISITGIWMREHPEDLRWLIALDRMGRLKITWINHSYNHYSSKSKPLSQNFLLAQGTNIREEIIRVEIALLERGIIPSVFFRFPGLVSDARLVQTITGFGLIPIGSDAWLGKNQIPHAGSIVLVHANGNEPIGLTRFLRLLSEEKENTRKKQWLLYDLRESIQKTEENHSP